MEIAPLINRTDIEQNKYLKKRYPQFQRLLSELNSKNLPDEIVSTINTDVEKINAIGNSGKELEKSITKAQNSILKLVYKEQKLVPKNYYRNTWMAIGMALFGLPLGVIYALSFDDFALFSLGIPIGLSLGLSIGFLKDKKCFEEGKQIDVEISY